MGKSNEVFTKDNILAPSNAPNNSNLGNVICFKGATRTLEVTRDSLVIPFLVTLTYTQQPKAFSEASVKHNNSILSQPCSHGSNSNGT